nr:hypothetical protein BaRGS_026097 [Batillaria attramentaria]
MVHLWDPSGPWLLPTNNNDQIRSSFATSTADDHDAHCLQTNEEEVRRLLRRTNPRKARVQTDGTDSQWIRHSAEARPDP